MIAGFNLALLVVAKQLAGPAPEHQAKKFTITPDQQAYTVGVTFVFPTTVLFPVDCSEAAVGDPDRYKAYYEKGPNRRTRRFILSVEQNRPGTSTAVTFLCDQGIQQMLIITQVPQDEAVLAVEFELDEKETGRVRSAVEVARKRCSEEKEEALLEARLKFQEDAKREVARGMIDGLAFSDEFTGTKSDGFINVKSRNALLAGNLGFILFEVQPRVDKTVTVKSVQVLEAESGTALPDVLLEMPQNIVGPNEIGKAAAVFSNPIDAREFTLVVNLDGGETIELKGIEL